MSFDCHAHWIPPALADALRARVAAPRIEPTAHGEQLVTYQNARPFGAALGNLNVRRTHLAKHGVRRQVLSLPGLFGVDSLPSEEAGPLVRLFNDELIGACARWPDQFAGLAALPLADMARSCEELSRACHAGLHGAILSAEGLRTSAGAARYRPLFALGERLGCHFFVHPGPVAPPPEAQIRSPREDNAWFRRIVLDTQASLSEVMLTLNYSDWLDPYPSVTVQVANLGGTLPFVLERMDAVAREHFATDEVPSMRRSRCHVDTASFGPRGIELAVAALGADRVVLGTDCPIFDTARSLQALAAARFDDDTRERIAWRNAQPLFATGAGPRLGRDYSSARERRIRQRS